MDSLNLFSWGWYKRFVCGVKFCDVGNKDVKGIKGKRLEAIDGWRDLISPNYIIIIITFTLQFPSHPAVVAEWSKTLISQIQVEN